MPDPTTPGTCPTCKQEAWMGTAVVVGDKWHDCPDAWHTTPAPDVEAALERLCESEYDGRVQLGVQESVRIAATLRTALESRDTRIAHLERALTAACERMEGAGLSPIVVAQWRTYFLEATKEAT